MSDKNERMDEIIEEAFIKSLRLHGFLFPETQPELEILKENENIEKVGFPSDLMDSMQIIENGKITRLSSFDLPQDSEVEENLARAAREGKEIPDDVKSQMKKDKHSSQQQNNDEKDRQ